MRKAWNPEPGLSDKARALALECIIIICARSVQFAFFELTSCLYVCDRGCYGTETLGGS